ncbi:MAG: ABC transporter substrate-binding protein [Candidatus Parvarchaeota archaeon]|nr:ABC transporter substrate-binding protein [Candidatus Jingweiarchaeum tengchongense]
MGEYISLETNLYFYGSTPKIPSVILKWIPDATTMLANVLSGTVDVSIVGLGLNEAKQAEQNTTIKVLRVPSTYWEHLEINLSDPILSDIRVQKAIAYGINYDDLNNRVFSGQRLVSNLTYLGLFNSYYRNSNARLPSHSLVLANRLLDDAGWVMASDGYRYKDGQKLTLELSTTTRQDRKDQVLVLKAQLRQIGIYIQTKFLSASYFFGTYTTHRVFQLAMFAYGGDILDPSGFNLFHSSQIPSEANGFQGQNYSGVSDSMLDNAIYTATHEVDPIVRKTYYDIAHQRIADLIPQIGLNVWTDIYTYKRNLMGIDYNLSSSIPITWNINDWYWSSYQYKITASSDSGGRINPSGTIYLPPNDSQTFVVSPDFGYHIADVLVDSVSVFNNVGKISPSVEGLSFTYTFQNVTSDHTIQAVFAPGELYFMVKSIVGAGGTMMIEQNNFTYQPGEHFHFWSQFEVVKYYFFSDPGFKIKDVLVDGNSVGPVSSYTFENIDNNHTIEAQFIEAVPPSMTAISFAGVDGTGSGDDWTVDISGVTNESLLDSGSITVSEDCTLTTKTIDGVDVSG